MRRPQDKGRCSRIALVAETIDQAREVMVFGESGIMACTPEDRKPVWEATRKRLVWPNGAVAYLMSAHDPESLRGPQFDGAWVDELAKWKKAEETWMQLQFALRLGENPRQVVTTTPRDVQVLKDILAKPSTVVTQAPTRANKANLAKSFLREVETTYGGRPKGRQELDGLLVEGIEGALWSGKVIAAAQEPAPEAFSRIVVAVDPPVTGHAGSDNCGIVVVGAVTEGPPKDWKAWVLEDATVSAAHPAVWARAAVAAFHRHKADRIVAEVNQGGILVETMLRLEDPLVPCKSVQRRRARWRGRNRWRHCTSRDG